MCVPGLLANLELVSVHVAGIIDDEFRCACGTAAGLIHEEYAVTFAEEDVAPAFASVRRGLPAGAGLAVAVQEDDGVSVAIRRNLIEGVGVVHVGGSSRACGIHPVLFGIIVSGDSSRDRSAGRENALFFNDNAFGGIVAAGGKSNCGCKEYECFFHYSLGNLLYSSSGRRSNHSTPGLSGLVLAARWAKRLPGAAPCQCLTPGGHIATSPGRRTSTGCPSI